MDDNGQAGRWARNRANTRPLLNPAHISAAGHSRVPEHRISGARRVIVGFSRCVAVRISARCRRTSPFLSFIYSVFIRGS